ncbi:WD repeat-containing protein 63 [Physocladia obscura]|uniref:WD repeat-containing protein 63 n=1 Tax=Physocladia obscura TaxID=109957 RepID=A0AAD5TB43_9FUNG|nr:WD repeat-containing protein 63 [Physocladia obscura]
MSLPTPTTDTQLSRQRSSNLLAPKSSLSKSPSKANVSSRSQSVTIVGANEDSQAIEKPPIGEALMPGNSLLEIPAEGIIPLFLTSMTQDIFKIKSGEDVTAEKPIKIIPKVDLLADIMARRAISDFQPALAKIQEYPGEELMVYFDVEYKYGQNFFLVINPDVVDLILKPPVIDPTSEDTTGIYAKGKKPVSKPWECLGSDKDIEIEQVTNTRDRIHVKISRPRKEFGKTYDFSDREGSDTAMECKSFKDPVYELNRMELGFGIQSIPEVESIACQTNWFRPTNFSVQYEPITLNEQDQKYLLETDNVIDFVKSVADSFDKVLQQNSILNIFLDDFKELGEEDIAFEKGTHSVLQEYQSFTDLQHSKDKSISCCDWHPIQKGVVAVSCIQRCTFDERVEHGFIVRSKQSLILIWSFHDPIHPQLILEAPEDINCFQFNPSDPNFIAGGCVNGQVILWEITEYEDKLKTNRKRNEDAISVGTGAGGNFEDDSSGNSSGGNTGPTVPIVKFIIASSIESSHRNSISDLQWLPSNMLLSHNGDVSENLDTGNRQLVTCSLDGQVCMWDTRSKKDLKALDLTWKPFIRVPLSAIDNTFDYGLTKVSLKSLSDMANTVKPKTSEKSEEKKETKKDSNAITISKFYTATEEGDLIFSDWVAEKSSEEKASRVEHVFSLHFGSMSDIQRSPFFPDIILSSGGWSFHIWKEKVNTGPLFSSPTSAGYIISGRWSPTRPSVAFISKSDGTIDVWDFLDSTYQPATCQNVASVGISYMTVKQYPGKGGLQFVSAADDAGTLHILEVPKNLTKPIKNEKQLTRAFFDREVKRLTYAYERKQIRAREKGPWEQTKVEAAQALKAQAAAAAAASAAASLAIAATATKKLEETDGAAPAAEIANNSSAVPASAGNGVILSPPDDFADKLEQEYLKFEKNFLQAEGLLASDE